MTGSADPDQRRGGTTGDRHGQPVTAWAVFRTFLYLGCTSFGGPVAHLGYFRALLVERKAWLPERAYADLVALCQFLPGPSSSQVGFGIGLMKAGWRGGLAAWLGFTMPSALLMAGFGLLLSGNVPGVGGGLPPALLSGLKLVAVAVVGHAVWSMSGTLAPDAPRRAMAAVAALVLVAFPLPALQLGMILAGALVGWTVLPKGTAPDARASGIPPTGTGSWRRPGFWLVAASLALLALLPAVATAHPEPWLQLADGFYRSGMLVFGGGHVVLPLLQSAVAEPGWVSDTEFLAGYGAAQAIPGPLFTVAAFLGQATGIGPMGMGGALVALIAIFAGSFMLLMGVLPYWDMLRGAAPVRRALDGVNAVVVGLLLAVLVNPIAITGVSGPLEAAVALAGFAVLAKGWLGPLPVVGLILAAAMGASALFG